MAQIWNRFRQLTFGSGKSAGRNSSGRITLFHRGGGAKRLQRRIDLKRSTTSMGIVERIEYDPNRSSRIALVRWKGGVHQKKCNSIEEEVAPPVTRLESTTATTIRGPFAFSSMPSCVKDVYSPLKARAVSSLSLGSSFSVPRMAVAGAMPHFFVCRKSEQLGGKNNTFSLGEIRKWSTGSSLWAHRIKRKAAVSWHSKKDVAGPVGASHHSKSKTKTKMIDQGSKKKFDRVPVTYMIASHQLEAGKMVMNWSKPA